MNSNIKYILTIGVFFILITAKAQINVAQQINTIPKNVNQYIDGYLHDLTTLQGTAYLNSLNTTGRVLGKWELNLSVKAGTAITKPYYINNKFDKNFELRGAAPSLFDSDTEGELFFHIIDETTGTGFFDPFTGEEIGFTIPLLPGSGVGYGLAPAVMPVFTLGVGYGTEVSVSVLPGAIKAASKSFTGDFEINKDMMYSFGLRHDVFHWVPVLNKRNFYLTVGATYSKMTIGANAGQGLFDDFENINSTLLIATNNLTGVDYGFTSFGFEGMLSKKLAFVDLSLFASTNQSDYFIQSKGTIDVKVANNLYSNDPQGYQTTTLENLVDVEGTTKRFIYGAAIQLNLGRFNVGAKYGVSDESYAVFSLGYKILKSK